MIYVYFFIKCVVRWAENSVRFKTYGNWLPTGPNFVRLYHCEILHVWGLHPCNGCITLVKTSLFKLTAVLFGFPNFSDFLIVRS